ncbi:hypothetical protein [Mesorhizobium sp. M1136]|uniref:hypothetical protein n=1 Tax=unclassified Mesorhizobium TaxID=325217 RepID=UPI0033366C38
MGANLGQGKWRPKPLLRINRPKANFAWIVNGGVVNFDTHGDGGGQSVSYEKGRSVPSDEGVLEAAFDGNHGWFWRNRGDREVTLTIQTEGDYIDIKRMI